MIKKGKLTEELLNYIAHRLSGRDDCRNVTYEVTIDHNGVSMSPQVFVYPNLYRKQHSDKLDVVTWAQLYKLPHAQLSDFVFGTYQYRREGESKKRRWTRK